MSSACEYIKLDARDARTTGPFQVALEIHLARAVHEHDPVLLAVVGLGA